MSTADKVAIFNFSYSLRISQAQLILLSKSEVQIFIVVEGKKHDQTKISTKTIDNNNAPFETHFETLILVM